MVQRSPSYVFALPNKVDPITRFLRWLSPALAYRFDRIRFLAIGYIFFYFCRAFPNAARGIIRSVTTRQLPKNIPHDPHFKPSYNPWEQRLCLSPDGDFYKSMRQGKAGVVTGVIDTVTPRSILMKDGTEVPCDIVVTATGLKLKLAGGINVSVDGEPYQISSKFMWKGEMLQDLPNAAFVIGYTNASWTLGADATAQTVTRLLNAMKKKGAKAVVPRLANPESMKATPVLNLNSTYIQRALDILPKTGTSGPWRPRSNYFSDISEAKWGNIEEGMEYIKEGKKVI
jgi:cation diffusion facilitator CzcD-associated flavoprotein CzcO